MLTGSSVALDGRLHSSWIEVPKSVKSTRVLQVDGRIEGYDYDSWITVMDASASVRATVLRIPTCSGLRELVVSDGSSGFWPYVLLLGADPASLLPTRSLTNRSLMSRFFLARKSGWNNPRAISRRRYRLRLRPRGR